MHAAIHQLLSLRDGEPVDVQIARHVEACASCSAELARLERVRSRLQSLTDIEPPAEAWPQIASRLQATEAPRRQRTPLAIAAALVVVVASGFVIRGFNTPAVGPPTVRLESPSVPTPISLDELVAQSQELDQMLQYLPERPTVERVALAATIDTIEARVQWLDQQLSYVEDTGVDDVQATQLWRERVDLMDSLVKVRYAEGAPMSF